MEKMRMESLNLLAENIDKISAIFPNCITERVTSDGKKRKVINFELLRQMLSDDVDIVNISLHFFLKDV